MKKTVYKFFGNYEKEEAWLNSMASQGWHCTDYFCTRYRFERGKPGEYIYRIQLLENPVKHPDSISYLEFLEDMGIEIFANQIRWVYFRKKALDGPFELFSDLESRIKHYQLILRILVPIALFNLFLAITGRPSWPLNLLNVGAAALPAVPSWAYHRRVQQLKAEKTIRE